MLKTNVDISCNDPQFMTWNASEICDLLRKPDQIDLQLQFQQYKLI